MDGVASQSSGIRILGTVNLPKSEIRPEILRSNRTHLLVEFHPLSNNEALSVAEYVKANLDKGFTFDQVKFDTLVKGEVTLADIYGCSLPESVNNIVKGIVDELESQMTSNFKEVAEDLQNWKSQEEEEEQSSTKEIGVEEIELIPQKTTTFNAMPIKNRRGKNKRRK